jgi:hypothetical protein
MKFLVTTYITCLFLCAHAQSNLFYFNVPQSVFVANEEVKFAIASTSDKPLYVYVKLQNTSSLDVLNAYIKVSNKLALASVKLPNEIKAGSYILTSYLLNANGIDVAESHSYMIHVTDGKCQNYEQLTSKSNKNDTNTKRDVVLKKRSKIEGSSIKPATTYAIVNSEYAFTHSYQSSIFDNKSIDTCFRLFYKLTNGKNDANKLAVLNLSTKFCSKVQDCSNGIVSTMFNESKANNELVFLDINAIASYDGLSYYSPSLVERLTRSTVSDPASINKLYKQSTDRIKIKQYMAEQSSDSSANQLVKLKADNEYVMENYEKFETLDLFFKEVVLPYKIDRSKGDFSIFLLTGVEKKWNKSKATLIIDGAIVNNHAKLFELKYEDVIAIRLYRKIETLRNHYGALGRNGVIEVTTKNPETIARFKIPNILNEKKNTDMSLMETIPDFDPSFFATSPNAMHNDCTGKFEVYQAMVNEWLGYYFVD